MREDRSEKGFNTKAVHSGEIRDEKFGNIITPIFETTTFRWPNDQEGAYKDSTRDQPFMYTRWGNPTIQSLEQKYASLDSVKYGLAFSSGMGAITSAIFGMCGHGSRILAVNELYGQTYSFLSSYLPKYGINCDFIPVDRMNTLDFSPKDYAMVYAESIINPTLKVSDLVKIGKFCSEQDVPVVVDATFASPFNQKPAEFGVNVVLHSGTKYLSGHTDVTIGMVGTRDHDMYDRIQNVRKTLGPVPDPLQAFLASRGLKTIGLRVSRQNQVSMELARYLEQNRHVSSVFHPGLESSPYNQIARKNLSGYGGMVSFEVPGGLSGARKFMRALRLPGIAPSLGGVESLVSLPVETSHSTISKEERRGMGIPDGLVRFSCGIDDPEDLIADMDNAFEVL